MEFPMQAIRKAVFFTLLALCTLPAIHPPIALILGSIVGLIIGNPIINQTHRWSKNLLKLSVIGLGFGITAQQVSSVGADAAVYTAVGISSIFLAGFFLTKLFRVEKETALLVTTGTAICGGSAIAAMAPTIDAKQHATSVALATVFTLNAVGLLIFPPIGHAFSLTQGQFGAWAAMAIHDTSSVVGACDTYGHQALAIGTIIKLTRALWIIPVSLIAAFAVKSNRNADDNTKTKVKVPWFLAGFIIAALLRSFAPQINLTEHMPLFELLYLIARQSLVVTIFLIGSGLTRQVIARVGFRPLILALALWILASTASLGAILAGLVPIPTLN
ncbi:MAG: YeiH family protein [Phycisphaerales bacterium]